MPFMQRAGLGAAGSHVLSEGATSKFKVKFGGPQEAEEAKEPGWTQWSF